MKKDSISVFSTPVLTILIAYMMVAGSALGQVYFEDDFSSEASLENWEIAGDAKWQIENGELVSRGSGDNWNVIVLKEELWEGWTDYTYELKITPEIGNRGADYIYQVFRYAQPVSTARTNFFAYMMDEANVNGLYIDRFVNGTRTRGVPGTMTFAGGWKNDEEHILKVEVTETDITGYLDGEKQFGPIQEANNADGRIGIGVWLADVRFDDVKVYGPEGEGLALESTGKAATTWGSIKAKF